MSPEPPSTEWWLEHGRNFHFWVNYPLNPSWHSKIRTKTKLTKEAVWGFWEGTEKVFLFQIKVQIIAPLSAANIWKSRYDGGKSIFCLFQKVGHSPPPNFQNREGKKVVGRDFSRRLTGTWLEGDGRDQRLRCGFWSQAPFSEEEALLQRSRMLFALIPPPSKQLGVTFTCGLRWRRTTEGIFLMLQKTNGRGERELYPV